MSYDDRNEQPQQPAARTLADLRKFLAERAQQTPRHAAAMDALLTSADHRVAAVRRKSSADQLRAVVHCIVDAALKASATPPVTWIEEASEVSEQAMTILKDKP